METHHGRRQVTSQRGHHQLPGDGGVAAGCAGDFAMQEVPAIPQKVVASYAEDDETWLGKVCQWNIAETVMTREDLMGQDVYQSHGLMDHGSVWGMGTYRGMDFSADTLHRWPGDAGLPGFREEPLHNAPPVLKERVADMRILSATTQAAGAYEITPRSRPALDAEVTAELRENRYDEKTSTLDLTPAQAYAMDVIRQYGQGIRRRRPARWVHAEHHRRPG